MSLIDPGIRPLIKESVESLYTKKPKGLLLMGQVGCGKTSILWVVYKYCFYHRMNGINVPKNHPIDSYLNLTFVTHAELINILRNSSGIGESENIGIPKKLQRRILLIDDFGCGYDDKAGWNLSLQDELFDYRWKRCLSTFISTNLTPSKLRKWPGWERIVDRIADPNWMTHIVVPGGSRRK